MLNALTNDQINSYFKNGYLLIENFFELSRMALAIAAINEILSIDDINSVAEVEPKDESVIRRIWAPTLRHPFFAALAADEKLLDIISCLIGNNIIFHYSKLNMKGPGVGSPVEWHQDFAYYPHTNTDLLSCLIFLDDANIQNGCLQVIPGSHKLGLCNHEVDGYFRGKILSENLPINVDVVHIEAPVGSLLILHCLTIHQSEKNISNKFRRTFLPAYRSADAYPIYVGAHTGDHEPTTKILRGSISKFARVEAGNWPLPLAEKEFNSLYELQEGSHIKKDRSKTGYYGHTIRK